MNVDVPSSDSSVAAFLPALFLFDCAMTLSQEIDVVWKRKWNATTLLYALTRYGTLINQINLLAPAWNAVVSRAQQILSLNISL